MPLFVTYPRYRANTKFGSTTGACDALTQRPVFMRMAMVARAASSFEVSQEGQVLMTLDKPVYQLATKRKSFLKRPSMASCW